MNLELDVSIPEMWDSIKNEFSEGSTIHLVLCHSLVAISKWEAKWHEPFLSKNEKTNEQLVDYIRCMVLEPKVVDPKIFSYIGNSDFAKIRDYISDPMSATKMYTNPNEKASNEKVTSELIYYWMISLGIPVQFENWHLNRLLTLIKVCGVKNQQQNAMGKTRKPTSSELANRARLNAARRKQLNTSG